MIKALIIDDEKHVRDEIKDRLADQFSQDIHVIDEAPSVAEALTKINIHEPDLVFLDIDIIGGTGFDVIERLEEVNFQLIFITGFNDQAIKAIRIGALDYLLKPIDDEEFSNAVNRAIKAFKNDDSIHDAVDVANQFYNGSHQDKIVLRTLEAHHVVYLEDIIFCKSDGNYTTFNTTKEKIMISKPLKLVESLLNKAVFLRCHQSYVVNTSYVTKYTNEGCLVLKNGEEVPVASRRKDAILKRLF
ncbi:LytR/AlgR family response regulator transcription factor [Reichenbachiella agariperforans]|uniref:LytR/AlgR family response regulator transcription factor n=1 Tax=Reichenbachiella agariperforans TaxID=156994 RepID=UPI001C088206|nr:LytTR family DNA-binding domain-containing protein [Reichenbachiella agariperforans]MBU2914475.1 LytTR family DNA-binding domain-containing protein [Reichenbachiella agariperforans]